MLNNKWMRGAIPALFLHSCIGSVYCWSLLKGEIAHEMEIPVAHIEFAFSLAIFFLGMSAAVGGRFVEKAVRVSSLLSCICFASGLFCSVWAIRAHSTLGLMLSYGCLMGIGLGLGYLSPVKTLMLTCGMYDGSGRFAVEVGVPTKSGVGGGLMAPVYGRCGIGIYGPALDQKGNCIAGCEMMKHLSREMGLHMFQDRHSGC